MKWFLTGFAIGAVIVAAAQLAGVPAILLIG